MKKRPITLVNAYSFLIVQDSIITHQRFPALFIDPDFLSFRSRVNGQWGHRKDFNYEVGKTYQITHHQFIENGKYWYEIIMDGLSKWKVENTQPNSFPSVRFFASDNFHGYPFTSDFGSICNFKVEQGETTGKYFPYFLEFVFVTFKNEEVFLKLKIDIFFLNHYHASNILLQRYC